jgi:hypothetical protein
MMEQRLAKLLQATTAGDESQIPEHINGLPEPLCLYVHDLSTRADPAGDVAQIASLKKPSPHSKFVSKSWRPRSGLIIKKSDLYKKARKEDRGLFRFPRPAKHGRDSCILAIICMTIE